MQIESILNPEPQFPLTESNGESEKTECSKKMNIHKVRIYSDSSFNNEIQPNSQINKDIIITFSLIGALSGTKGTRVHVDESVLFLGKRKNYQNSINGVSISAQLLFAETRIAVPMCKNCLKNSTQIVKIRNAIIDENNAVNVSASVTCSGSPPNSNRFLLVEFFIRDAVGNIMWRGDSPLFTLFHHRSKRNSNVEKNEQVRKIYQQLGELAPKPVSSSTQMVPKLSYSIPFVYQETNTQMLKIIEHCINNMWSFGAIQLRGKIADDVHFSFGPHKIVGLDFFLGVCNALAVSLDGFESNLVDVCFSGTPNDGRVATKSISQGKWVRPVGTFEGNGENVIFTTFAFWNFKDGKIVNIDSAIDNSRVPKWQLAWNTIRL